MTDKKRAKMQKHLERRREHRTFLYKQIIFIQKKLFPDKSYLAKMELDQTKQELKETKERIAKLERALI